MLVIAACFAAVCAGTAVSPPDTLPSFRAPREVSVSVPILEFVPADSDRITSIPAAVADDTTHGRRRHRVVAVEYSDWYSRRLTIHRWASYATLPLFVGNYVTGEQLLNKGNQAPRWAIRSHGPLATAVATLFAVNTITGGMNLWEGRKDPSGRGWRTTHAILMLVADAGFTTAGILSNSAERSDQKRRLHRTVALSSIGVSLVSYIMMIPPFRRD